MSFETSLNSVFAVLENFLKIFLASFLVNIEFPPETGFSLVISLASFRDQGPNKKKTLKHPLDEL